MTARLLLPLLAIPFLAGTARAQIVDPDPRFSIIDPIVVGSPLGVAIGGTPAGYDVDLRDVDNSPRPNVPVTLHFPAAFRLYATQQPGTTVDCAQGTLTRITDAQGKVKFIPRIGGWIDNNGIEVVDAGVVLALVKGRSPDYDGDGRVALSDFVTFSSDFISAPGTQKSDFDLNGSTGLGDLVIFSAQFLGASQAQPLCP